MAVRQYIGARYTIKVYENSLDPSSAEWESGVAYEPLTLVTYNNSSYLSKNQVGAGVGNPATNPSYWVCTGYYNGQIISLQTADAELLTMINKRVIIVGDSFATGYNPDGNTTPYPDIIASRMGISSDNLIKAAQNGIGFGTSSTYLTALQSIESGINDKDTITDIYVIGGSNDRESTAADITSGVSAFKTHTANNYPNAKLHYIYIANLRDPAYWGRRQTQIEQGFVIAEIVGGYGFTFSNISSVILKNSDTASDHLHPTQACQYFIADAVQSQIYGNGQFERIAKEEITNFTGVSPTVYDPNANMKITVTKDTEKIRLDVTGSADGTFNASSTSFGIEFNFTSDLLCVSKAIDCLFIICPRDANYVRYAFPATIRYTGNNMKIMCHAVENNNFIATLNCDTFQLRNATIEFPSIYA